MCVNGVVSHARLFIAIPPVMQKMAHDFSICNVSLFCAFCLFPFLISMFLFFFSRCSPIHATTTWLQQVINLVILTLLVASTFDAAKAKTKIDLTSQSIVNRLNPTLRKALLKALTNIEINADDQQSGIDIDNSDATNAGPAPSDELLSEESTGTDLKALNLYNSYFTDAVNFTQHSKDDNEIIHTIIVKSPKATAAPSDDSSTDDQVIIQFGPPDPVKDSDVHIETVQIARSVKTNEIDDGDSGESRSNEAIDDVRVTTYKPFLVVNATSVTTRPIPVVVTPSTTTTSTTPAPTHNEDGENIEKVAKNDVKIFQAPLVAAFTVHQDELGLPRNVIPLVETLDTKPFVAEPLQEFVIDTSNRVPVPSTTQAPLTPSPSSTPFAFQLPTIDAAPSFTLSKSLELPSTKEAAYSPFTLDQKRKQLVDQIALLQHQRYQQEESFRRIEEENRARLQQYEQESEYLRHGLTSLSRFSVPAVPTAASPVQVIPSLTIPTQQLLPVREPKPFNSFGVAQSLFVPPQIATHLVPGPQLPIKPAQQFNSNVGRLQSFGPNIALNNIDPLVLNEQSRNRHRVFRHESNTGNFGNSISTNFPPFYPALNADSQLQNLLIQSGISAGRANEDFNIISKVLSLNHGVIPPGPATFYPVQQGRFVRSTTD